MEIREMNKINQITLELVLWVDETDGQKIQNRFKILSQTPRKFRIQWGDTLKKNLCLNKLVNLK